MERHMDFLKRTGGLVTMEWVCIAAVMVLAAISVTSFIMQGSSDTGVAVRERLQAAEPGPATLPNLQLIRPE
jgi:hypothetical protein